MRRTRRTGIGSLWLVVATLLIASCAHSNGVGGGYLGAALLPLEVAIDIANEMDQRAKQQAEEEAFQRAIGPTAQAQVLASVAVRAAQSGDCVVADGVDLYVLDLDERVHDSFARDSAVARCLEGVIKVRAAQVSARERCRNDRSAAFARAKTEPDAGQRVQLLLALPAECFQVAMLTNESFRELARETAIERSWTVTKRAAIAAASGDCATLDAMGLEAKGLALELQRELGSELAPTLDRCTADSEQRRSNDESRRRDILKSCLDNRAAKLRAAVQLSDLQLRARALQSIPACVAPAPPPSVAMDSAPKRPALDRGWQIMKAARAWPAVGSCKRAQASEASVLALDVSFHDTVFARDLVIARCLTSIETTLPASIVLEGLAKVKPGIKACGTAFSGVQVKLSLDIAADGHVSAVVVTESPDPWLGNCLSGKLKDAVFVAGFAGSVSYSVSF